MKKSKKKEMSVYVNKLLVKSHQKELFQVILWCVCVCTDIHTCVPGACDGQRGTLEDLLFSLTLFTSLRQGLSLNPELGW